MKTIWIKCNYFGAREYKIIIETEESYVIKGIYSEMLINKKHEDLLTEKEAIKRKNFFSKINKRINRIKKMKNNL